MAARPQPPTDQELVDAVARAAAAPGFLFPERRIQRWLVHMDITFPEARGLLAGCTIEEMVDSGPDRDEQRNNWVGEFRIPMEDGEDVYAKVAMNLPDMKTGVVLSFKPWVD